MAEKLIYLEGVDPVDFYGVNNVRFNKFIELFPDLKIVSRGNEIRISGKKERLVDFEERVDLFLRYLRKFQSVTLPDLENLLKGSVDHKMETPGQ
jgi:phosphate starvation-inducible PhoH-like protein